MGCASGLLRLENRRLEVWGYEDGTIGVAYANCDVKVGCVLRGVYGKGRTFEEACEEYRRLISGKTLVFTDHGVRKEVTVL